MILLVIWFFLRVVNNLKERNFSPDQINRHCLDLILCMRDKNYYAMKSLRCLDSAVNETFY